MKETYLTPLMTAIQVYMTGFIAQSATSSAPSITEDTDAGFLDY